MSRAFVKEEDAAGFDAPPSSSSISIPEGPFRVTAAGARLLAAMQDEAVTAAMTRAEILPPQKEPERAALGVTVCVRTGDGDERKHRLVTAEEYALLGEGVSIGSPLGRALLGGEAGDVRELRAPKGSQEIEIVRLEGEE
jgi:transcription elongation GreA/GreB family factor